MVAPPDTTLQLPSPRKALLAGFIPGGGQLYNRRWIKFGIVIAAQSYFTYNFLENRENFNNYDSSLPLSEGRYLAKRNKYAWWMGLIYLWGMVDGYVDAHLASFPDDSLNVNTMIIE
ncbi:DUF5683 domain-containing protein [Candidatus Neomarinimicrobiota bacterium]